MPPSFNPDTIHGVDFSGAKLAGDNIWIASARRAPNHALELRSLSRLADLAGSAERGPALAHLVHLILTSRRSLWAIDFPFGLPVEVMDPHLPWPGQLDLVTRWPGDAPGLGRWCLNRALAIGPAMHIRRTTDTLVKTPFDCYHYRIIYQTFHGMRDVLAPLLPDTRTAVLPFQYDRLASADRVVVEACPSSTLKRLSLPHQNYKQPAGGPLTRLRLNTRRRIVDGITQLIQIPDALRRVLMRNPGGDALDAVLATVGADHAWRATDHSAVASHARFPREGFIYA